MNTVLALINLKDPLVQVSFGLIALGLAMLVAGLRPLSRAGDEVGEEGEESSPLLTRGARAYGFARRIETAEQD